MLSRGLGTGPLGTSQSPAWAALQSTKDSVGQRCEAAVSTCLHPSTVSECIDNNSHGLLVSTAAMCLIFLLPLLVRGMQTFASITNVNSQITHSAPHSEPYYRMCTYRLQDGCQRLIRQGVLKRPERSKLWEKMGT